MCHVSFMRNASVLILASGAMCESVCVCARPEGTEDDESEKQGDLRKKAG